MLGNMQFKQKLMLLVFLPVLVSSLLLIQQVMKSYRAVDNSTRLAVDIELITVNSALVHELQKERGATAGFLGSGGTKFQDVLAKQRTSTDAALAAWRSFVSANSFDGNELNGMIAKARNDMGSLATMRQRVSALSVEAKEAISFYTKANKNLLSGGVIAAGLSSDVSLVNATLAYANFQQGKERAGIERAVLSNTFARDAFGEGMFARFVTLVTEQNLFAAQFFDLATPEHKAILKSVQNSVEAKNVQTYRDVAMANASKGGFGRESTEWFKAATQRINLLKKTEDKLAADLISAANAYRDQQIERLALFAIVFVVTLLVVITMSWLIIRGLHRQMDSLSQVMARVSEQKDLTGRVTVYGNDELGQVANALNETLDHFSDAIRQLNSSCATLVGIADETREAVNHSSSKLEDQRARTTQVAAAVEELSVSVKEVAGSTVAAAERSGHASSLASSGRDTVKASVASVNNLSTDIQHLSDVVGRLNDSSVNISNVIDVINGVSDQIGLLSLNAAIEAARAGEQGRGFAVVADEVRTLAQRTQNSTTEIAEIIQELQREVGVAFKLVEQNLAKMRDTVEHTNHVEISLDEIVGSVSHITDMSNQIAAASEEQAAVIEDASHSLTVIDHNADDVVSAGDQIRSSADRLAEMSLELQGLVRKFVV
ncbi:methyl-accepting chemotaxis protein [Neptunomonas marina]|uniref:HAMP domain-containing protein n=1 Tax=Neptunomonas marina TaxID=1815562 RepID=A0A437QDF8_9GAMM|nr:methyl-accepting chemotaxis protein [Neptunomonas marina]RVU32564.1 HAMP domain-containing protein [Neptunomonas marina]